MNVTTVRLDKKELEYIKRIAKKEKRDKSAIIRELLAEGIVFSLIKSYKKGRLSLGKLAEELEISISEAIDLLSEFGIESSIQYEDYLEGFHALKKIKAK